MPYLPCRLREIRGKRPLREVAEEAGLNRGALSDLERGYRLPREAWVSRLEAAYGVSIEEWYDRRTLLALRLEHDQERGE